MLESLIPLARSVAEALIRRGERLAVAESSSGGLISAALLAVPGASAYFLGGAVVYTAKARMSLMGLPREAVAGMRSASEPYAALLAATARENFGADWGLSETGAAGPTGNPYGDAAGHSCVAVSGRVDLTFTLETGSANRAANMQAFAARALELMSAALEAAG
ncbi:MAG TPA: CinA family protein [Caulobacteraceae bacterium]|nr:CinA family protein [Caulobacteraceae bacterium]